MALDPDLTEFTTASPIVASYNYTDVANGLGYELFYGVAYKDSVGEKQMLSPLLVDQDGEVLGSSTLDGSSFNTSKTVKGTAVLNGLKLTNGTVTAKLQHYDGSTATDISSAIITSTITNGNTFTMLLPLTEKLFRAGDNIRLILTLSAGHVSSTVANPFKLNIPFKLDI